MKSLLKENLILNLHTKIIVKKYALKNSKLYFGQYSKAKNTLIIIDEFLISNKKKIKYIKSSLKFIKNKKFYINKFYEPSFDNLGLIKKKFNNINFDLVIGIGGGSTIDLAKGYSVVSKYKNNLENLQGLNKFSYEAIPVICIPSVFGSGAEITPSAVFINNIKKIKGGINSEKLTPKLAILDSYLAQSENYKQHATCAYDALVHSIESNVSNISNKFTKKLSIYGAEMIFRGLKLLSKKNNTAFDYLAQGSIYSIISLMHSEQSIAGASSYPMAVFFKKKHAECGANYLTNSIKIINKKKKNLFDEIILNLYKNKLIKKATVGSLISELQFYFKYFKINQVDFDSDQKLLLVNKIYEMKMLDFSPVKFNKRDIIKFLNR